MQESGRARPRRQRFILLWAALFMEIRQLERQAVFPILMKHQEMRSAMKESIHRISSRFRATRRAQLPTFLFPAVLWAAVCSDGIPMRRKIAIRLEIQKRLRLFIPIQISHLVYMESWVRNTRNWRHRRHSLLSVTMFPSAAAVLQRTVQSWLVWNMPMWR